MKKRLCLLVLAAMLLLTACAGSAGNVEELLEAPKLSQSQTRVVEELNRTIGGTAKLKYPRRGDFLSPFVFKDLNGDGTDEAVVFYTDDTSEQKSKNVKVALLAQTDGKWSVLWDAEGLGTEIEAVSFSTMYGADTATLLVGYTSASLSDKFLAVYTYKAEEHTMQQVDKRSYSEYALADFTGNGTDDLMVLSPSTQPGPMQVSLLTVQGGELQPVTTYPLDTLLQSSSAIYTSISGGQTSLVVDGITSGGTLASEELYFDAANSRLSSHSARLGVSIPTLSTRTVTSLRSRDIDEDGSVEIPVVQGSVSAFSTDQRMLWVSFYDFAAISVYQNNFEKETVQPGRQIPSVLPVTSERSAASATASPSPAPSPGTGAASSSGASSGTAPSPSPAPTPVPTETPAEPTNEKSFGLADLSYGYYMPLPVQWKNRITVQRLGARDWYLTDTASGETLLTVQILGSDESLMSGGIHFGDAGDYTQVAAVGRYRIFVRVRPDTGIDTAEILGGVTVLS